MVDEKSVSKPLTKKLPGNCHDRFFKAIFQTPAQVWAMLEMVLTPAQLATLDGDSLVIRPNGMINQASLQEYVSDLIVEAKFTDGSDFVLTLICEHKSYNDKQLMSQLLSYIARLYEQKAKVVVPIVIYHGKQPWTQRCSFYETQHADLSPQLQSVWGHLLVNFGLELLNLRQGEVLARLMERSLTAHLGMQVMGEIWEANEQRYVAWVERMLGFKKRDRRQFIRLLSSYLTAAKPEVNMVQMRELSQVARPDDATMREALDLWERIQPESAAEYFDVVRKKARKEALAEGHKKACMKIAKRMLNQGMADADIEEITQLSSGEIARLKNGGSRRSDV